MSDHWKSIADLLGAPGMDARRRLPVEPPALGPASSEYIETTRKDKEPLATPIAEKAVERDLPARGRIAVDASPPAVKEQKEEKIASQPEAKHEPKSEPVKRRSSWDSLTKMFGLSSASEEVAKKPEPTTVEEAPARVVREPAPRASSRSERVESERPRPRLDSPPAIDDASDSQANSALDALFQDAPRQPGKDWREESSLRIVDDVSWDIDDSDDDVSKETSSSAPTSDEDSSGRGRRRRRRRRGGRGRDRDSTESTSREPDEQAVIGKVGWDDEPAADDSVEILDPWGEPKITSRDSEALDSENSEFEAERRSNRRRRRGRGSRRNDEAEGTVPNGETEAGARKEKIADRSTDSDRDTTRRDATREVARGGDSDHRRHSSDRDRTLARGRDRTEMDRTDRDRPERETRERTAAERSSSSDRVRASVDREIPKYDRSRADDASDEIDEVFDVENENELDEGGNKHRRIPTWADSLESIIANNMENHRRYDGGRDHGPRGRPRGRR